MSTPIPPHRRGVDLPPSDERLAADVDAELTFHIEERIAQLVAAGLSREEATLKVRERFGDVEAYRSATRAVDEETLRRDRRASWVDGLRRELLHAVRSLRRSPAFTGITLSTLALGLAAAAAMFAVVDAVILRPLPYTNSGELVSVLHPATVPGSGERRWGISPGGYFHIQQHNASFRTFGIYGQSAMTITSGGNAEQVTTARITHTVQDVLGASVALGRRMQAGDDRPGASPVVVLSHEFHQRRFGGDASIVGTTLTTDNGPVEVIGVMSPGLTLPMPGPFATTGNLKGLTVDAWLPLGLDPAGPFWNNHPYVGVGRLRAGVTSEAATRDLSALLTRFPEWMPNAYSPRFLANYSFRIEARPLRDAVLGDRLPRVLWMLFAAAGMVLAIAAANVANLFLVRQETRRHEAAVRTAIGADRRQMALHFLAESLLMCVTASGLALGIAWAVIRMILVFAPASVPRLASVTLQWPTITFAVSIALVLGVVLGLVPLLRHGAVLARLREGGRGASDSRRARLVRQFLVGGQVALTLLLLTAGGALLGGASRLRAVKPGFTAQGVLAFDVSLPFATYDRREKALEFHRTFMEQVRALPGVASVGAGALPLEEFGTGCAVVFREGRPYAGGEQTPCVSVTEPLPGYFETLGITVEGQAPTWSDISARNGATLVTRALADRLWPGEDPVGKGIGSNGTDSDVWYRIVGVVPEMRAEALDRGPTEGAFYAPFGLRPNQRSDALNYHTYVVRVRFGDPLALVNSVRAVLRGLDAQVPLIAPRRFEDVVARSMAGVTFSLVLMASAGVIGLLLSAVGLYGVVWWLVAARRAEIGVRVALGAKGADVLRLVLGSAVRIAVVGAVVGSVGSILTGKVLEGMVGTASPWGVLAAALALLFVVVAVASWSPARAAVRIEPVEAMRRG